MVIFEKKFNNSVFYYSNFQSDVIHQSVYELVHSEDREELQRQLGWDSFLGQEDAGISLQELLSSDHHHLLDRSFTVRFRCLLDNTSGFLVRIIQNQTKFFVPTILLLCP